MNLLNLFRQQFRLCSQSNANGNFVWMNVKSVMLPFPAWFWKDFGKSFVYSFSSRKKNVTISSEQVSMKTVSEREREKVAHYYRVPLATNTRMNYNNQKDLVRMAINGNRETDGMHQMNRVRITVLMSLNFSAIKTGNGHRKMDEGTKNTRLNRIGYAISIQVLTEAKRSIVATTILFWKKCKRIERSMTKQLEKNKM